MKIFDNYQPANDVNLSIDKRVPKDAWYDKKAYKKFVKEPSTYAWPFAIIFISFESELIMKS